MLERMRNIWRELRGSEYYSRCGNKQRMEGWNSVRHYMGKRVDGEPMLKIFNTCKYLIETIPEQMHSDSNPEDLDTDAEDHAVDALRYMLASYKKLDYSDEKILSDKEKIALGRKSPIDIGGGFKMPNGEIRLKREPVFNNTFMLE